MKNKTRTSSATTAAVTPPGESFRLDCRQADEPAPALCGVQACGRLDGVLFELTLRQTYRNAGRHVLEVVYTFPLPHAAVLLGFASELGGQRQVGTIVAKREAEAQYEKALAEGDAPVMLEAGPDGLHTANIGNLKPGEEIVLEVRFAQLLAFEQGRLRLVLPTTIAPRYGSAAAAGLEPQQVPHASLQAEYPLALSIDIGGALAGAAVECPTHAFTRQAVDGGLRLSLDRGAWLDRDLVILVTPAESRASTVIRSVDAQSTTAPVVLMAALQPPVANLRQGVALKLLVDCSGSMGGDSIESARTALLGVLARLTAQDRISVTRFGSSFEHMMSPIACSEPALRRAVYQVKALEADLGGTEMEGALQAVFDLPVREGSGTADVLLVTDGEIWQVREMIAAARDSGHRVFVIGVGSSPAEALLRALAKATGGACEFATPGEALESAADRMLTRIRRQPWRGVRIDWGGTPVWQTPVPTDLFGGDTVLAFAGLATEAIGSEPRPAVRLLADGADGPQELARADATTSCSADTLPRIAAARRMVGANVGLALKLAVDYQLMSEQTNCILVHVREGADKTTEQAELHRVSSMLAAGWGATGSVHACASVDASMDMASQPQAAPESYSRAFAPRAAAVSYSMADPLDMDAQTRESKPVRPQAILKEIAQSVVDHLTHGGQVRGLPSHCQALKLHRDVIAALKEAVAIGATDGVEWLLLALWVNVRPGGVQDAAITQALEPHVALLDPPLIDVCLAMFGDRLDSQPVDGGRSSRARRLARALSGARA